MSDKEMIDVTTEVAKESIDAKIFWVKCFKSKLHQ